MKKVGMGLMVGLMLSTVTVAEENVSGSLSGTSSTVSDIGGCASNFSDTGSFLAGKQFQTSVVLPEIDRQVAFRRALAIIKKSSPDWTSELYRITASDEKAGVITAIWGGVGNEKTTPLLTLHIESVSRAGTKIDFTFFIAGGTMTSIEGVGNAFCKIASAVLSSTEFDNANPVITASATDAQSEDKASNSEYRKNGRPCVKEICLGDGLDELRKVKWDKSNRANRAKVTKMQMTALEEIFRGKLIASAPYITWPIYGGGEFDNQALSKLDEVIAICNGFLSLSGTFTTQSGNPTTVDIELIPTQDNKEQKWTVVAIRRSFPMASSKKQYEEIRAQLETRYGEFIDTYARRQKRADGEKYYVYSDNSGDGFNFSLYTKKFVENSAERLLHPACGGKEKINID